MDAQPRKLNLLQRGFLQKTATVAIYLAGIGLGALILDLLEKRRFIVAVDKARQQGIVTAESFRDLKTLIEAMDSAAIFAAIMVALLCVVSCWFLMRWSAKLNWSWPVVLPKAVEFRSAMRRLGISDPTEQIDFARKWKLPVFIASEPLLEEEQEAVRAKLYAFAHHSFSENDVFERHTGKQTLCIDAEDFERLEQEGKRRVSLEQSVAVAAKDEEIKALRICLASVTAENTAMREELETLRGKVQIQPAQEKDRVERLRVERLQWAALTPIIVQFIAEPKKDGKYTTPDIESAFAAAWQERTDLRAAMARLTGSEETKPSEAVIAAVKAELKDAGLFSAGGRPRKNP